MVRLVASADIAAHYGRSDLVESIRDALAALDIEPEAATLDDLAPVDEFHLGGRPATRELAERLDLGEGLDVLDVGCGLGGTARFIAHDYGCRVTGLDLTPEYVDAARQITEWLGLGDRIDFHVGSALDMPFADASFDRAVIVHVGMNIEDKTTLFSQLARVLRPGGLVGVYDVMRRAEGDLVYPVPWSDGADASFLERPDAYLDALASAGFEFVEQRDRYDFALGFMQARREQEESSGRMPVGLHLLMGESAATKLSNMTENLAAGIVAPFEIYARRSAHQPSS